MRPVILVIHAGSALDVDNGPCAVRVTPPEMPDNHVKDVVLGFDFGDVHPVGSLVETHHPEHPVHLAAHGTRDGDEGNHFETGGIPSVIRFKAGKQFAQISEHVHLDIRFLGAETSLEQTEDVFAGGVHDSPPESFG